MRLFFLETAENLHAGLFLERAFYLEDFTFIRRGEFGSSLLLHLCPWAWDDGSPESLVSCGGWSMGERNVTGMRDEGRRGRMVLRQHLRGFLPSPAS